MVIIPLAARLKLQHEWSDELSDPSKGMFTHRYRRCVGGGHCDLGGRLGSIVHYHRTRVGCW